jgi:hypothetical protein
MLLLAVTRRVQGWQLCLAHTCLTYESIMYCLWRWLLMLTPVSVTYSGTPYTEQRTSTCEANSMHRL